MKPAGYGSASGAIQELKRIGAVEGVHYRLSAAGELITDFIIAIDTGPMVTVMQDGFDIISDPGLAAFAVLNPDGMELVGARIAASKMRSGSLPAEAAYVLGVD